MFYLLATVISAFVGVQDRSCLYASSAHKGQILAFGLMQMNGISGRAGWRWIFTIEGVITVLVAIVGYFLFLVFPGKTLACPSISRQRRLLGSPIASTGIVATLSPSLFQ